MPFVLFALAAVALTAALAYVGYRLDIEREHARIASGRNPLRLKRAVP